MCYRDKNNVAVGINDVVKYAGARYVVKYIEDYDCATVAIAEKLDSSHSIDTLLLRDIEKI